MQYDKVLKAMSKIKQSPRAFGCVFKTEAARVVYTDGFGILFIDTFVPDSLQNKVFSPNGLESNVTYPKYNGILPKNDADFLPVDIDARLVQEIIRSLKPGNKFVLTGTGISLDGEGIPCNTLVSFANMVGAKLPTSIDITNDGLYRLRFGNDVTIYLARTKQQVTQKVASRSSISRYLRGEQYVHQKKA